MGDGDREKEKREGKRKGRNCTESFGPSSNLVESRDRANQRASRAMAHRPESIADWQEIQAVN